jgi:hypothetical protein
MTQIATAVTGVDQMGGLVDLDFKTPRQQIPDLLGLADHRFGDATVRLKGRMHHFKIIGQVGRQQFFDQPCR